MTVIDFPGRFSTCGPTEARAVLEGAMGEGLDQVMVLGFDERGRFYLAANRSYLPDLAFMLDLAKAELVKQYEAAE